MDFIIPETLCLENLRSFLKDILIKFEKGEITSTERIYYSDDIEDYIYEKYTDTDRTYYPYLTEDDPRSIGIEVLEHFNFTNSNFEMLPEDVPHFVEFLDTPLGKEKDGWEKFKAYIDQFDLDERLAESKRRGFLG
jgi:hypothetical protein